MKQATDPNLPQLGKRILASTLWSTDDPFEIGKPGVPARASFENNRISVVNCFPCPRGPTIDTWYNPFINYWKRPDNKLLMLVNDIDITKDDGPTLLAKCETAFSSSFGAADGMIFDEFRPVWVYPRKEDAPDVASPGEYINRWEYLITKLRESHPNAILAYYINGYEKYHNPEGNEVLDTRWRLDDEVTSTIEKKLLSLLRDNANFILPEIYISQSQGQDSFHMFQDIFDRWTSRYSLGSDIANKIIFTIMADRKDSHYADGNLDTFADHVACQIRYIASVQRLRETAGISVFANQNLNADNDPKTGDFPRISQALRDYVQQSQRPSLAKRVWWKYW